MDLAHSIVEARLTISPRQPGAKRSSKSEASPAAFQRGIRRTLSADIQARALHKRPRTIFFTIFPQLQRALLNGSRSRLRPCIISSQGKIQLSLGGPGIHKKRSGSSILVRYCRIYFFLAWQGVADDSGSWDAETWDEFQAEILPLITNEPAKA